MFRAVAVSASGPAISCVVSNWRRIRGERLVTKPAPGPLVSFLTTVYGTEDYLPAMIESVRAQTAPGWELVIVDNGMSDAVVEIVSRYASDGRIRLVRQENRGYRGGVTAAADAATGRYLSVLDSDDKVMPAFVGTMTEAVGGEPGIDAV